MTINLQISIAGTHIAFRAWNTFQASRRGDDWMDDYIDEEYVDEGPDHFYRGYYHHFSHADHRRHGRGDGHSVNPPRFFYRVQHRDSFTYQHRNGGFEAYYRYENNPRHWLHRRMIHGHVNGNPYTHTPFISVYDNVDAANSLATSYRASGARSVRIWEIDAYDLEPGVLKLRYRYGTVYLPVWNGPHDCCFFSARDARRYLGVRRDVADDAEWFALQFIPGRMVADCWRPSEFGGGGQGCVVL